MLYKVDNYAIVYNYLDEKRGGISLVFVYFFVLSMCFHMASEWRDVLKSIAGCSGPNFKSSEQRRIGEKWRIFLR